MVLPLDGVRVVSLGVSISGPLGLRHLADFGAEVIKVEPPGGDMVRHWDRAVGGEGSAHFWVNPNKRSVVLNLKDERGRAVLRKLLAVACASEATWHRFAEALGHPEWKDDARFRDNASRYAHRAELEAAFLPILATREREAWRQVFLDQGVPCASVNSLAEVCEHPQAQHRALFPEIEGPYGPIRLGRFPVRFSGLQPRLAHPPKTGADTAAVLRELGMDDKEIAALQEGGVIG